MRLLLAFLAAILAPALLMTALYLYGQFMTFEADDPYIWIRTRKWLVLSLTISTAYVVVMGIPAYALLRWRNAIRWWSTVIAGFIAGALPVAVLAWPLRYGESKTSASYNGVDTMIDGVPTLTGWIHYVEGLASFGALGAFGAFAFWLVRMWTASGAIDP